MKSNCLARYRVALGILVILLLSAPMHASGHGIVILDAEDEDRKLEFPDTAHYITLVADLHTHTVFSDGHVWPKIRVAEALRDGLDALAITDHLEAQPHQHALPNHDRNTAYNEARFAASGSQLIVISGSEITRNAPAGHMNAVFIEDANALLPIPEAPEGMNPLFHAVSVWPPESAVSAANEQGAFVCWNHPWSSPDTPNRFARMTDFHKLLIEKGQLHGIEIVNGSTYNEEAHQIALDNDLAFIGTSDIHDLIDWEYDIYKGGHRPVTLVLCEARSPEGLKEALFAHRTVVWFKNLLIGRAEHLGELLDASLIIENVEYLPNSEVILLTLKNLTSTQFRLRHISNKSQSLNGHADLVDVEPKGSIQLVLKPAKPIDEVKIEFEVLNALTSPTTHPKIVLQSPVKQQPKLGTEYKYDKEPSFTIAFPPGATLTQPTSADQVFAATTTEGITFQAAVAEIPSGVPLDKAIYHYADILAATGVGSDLKITANSEITLKDGTSAYRSEIQWFYKPAGVRLTTQAVSAYKDSKLVRITAHSLTESINADKIVESLRLIQ